MKSIITAAFFTTSIYITIEFLLDVVKNITFVESIQCVGDDKISNEWDRRIFNKPKKKIIENAFHNLVYALGFIGSAQLAAYPLARSNFQNLCSARDNRHFAPAARER